MASRLCATHGLRHAWCQHEPHCTYLKLLNPSSSSRNIVKYAMTLYMSRSSRLATPLQGRQNHPGKMRSVHTNMCMDTFRAAWRKQRVRVMYSGLTVAPPMQPPPIVVVERVHEAA